MKKKVELNYDQRGLIPAVIQDARTKQVLMLGWMNGQALELTRNSGQVHFWSRSRSELWRKGSTSGNSFTLVEMTVDCDGDALLLQVDPAGPACHTGHDTCFFRKIGNNEIDGVKLL